MLQNALVGALVKAAEIVWAKYGPQILEKVTAVLKEFGQQLLEKIAALLPVVFAAGFKQLADKIPNLDILTDPAELAEKIRVDASAMLEDGVDIPIVSEWGKKLLGIDLTELLGKRT